MINGLLLLILILACTLPRLWLNRVCDDLSETAQLASAAIRAEADPGPYLAELERVYERAAPKLQLFLDHAAVDEVGAAVGVCAPLTGREAILSALNAVQAAVAHLRSIESLSLGNIF